MLLLGGMSAYAASVRLTVDAGRGRRRRQSVSFSTSIMKCPTLTPSLRNPPPCLARR